MGNIYTGIELGTNSVKVVVVEKIQNKYNLLASANVLSTGIRDGVITDTKKAVNCCKKAISDASTMLGYPIKKVIACVPPTDSKVDIVIGQIEVMDKESITGNDISNVVNEAIKDHITEGYEIITATPISFMVDDKENIRDPKGMNGEVLEVKLVISSVIKEPLYKLLEVLNLSGVETVDVCYTSTGDYYASIGEGVDNYVGAVINIGEESTNVSVFNKGIQIKHSILPFGSINVDKDLSYVFDLKLSDSRKIKENFALACSSLSSNTESITVIDKNNETKNISQEGVSKVVESRLLEILKLSKSEIKNLTNREIRYIIITGGLSELHGFDTLVDNEFNGLAKVCNISTIGIRNNKYSSSFGATKYFDQKLALRGKSYSMVDNNDKDTSTDNNKNNENFLDKVFGHLFD